MTNSTACSDGMHDACTLGPLFCSCICHGTFRGGSTPAEIADVVALRQGALTLRNAAQGLRTSLRPAAAVTLVVTAADDLADAADLIEATAK